MRCVKNIIIGIIVHACTYENGKCLGRVIDDSVITRDTIIKVTKIFQ